MGFFRIARISVEYLGDCLILLARGRKRRNEGGRGGFIKQKWNSRRLLEILFKHHLWSTCEVDYFVFQRHFSLSLSDFVYLLLYPRLFLLRASATLGHFRQLFVISVGDSLRQRWEIPARLPLPLFLLSNHLIFPGDRGMLGQQLAICGTDSSRQSLPSRHTISPTEFCLNIFFYRAAIPVLNRTGCCNNNNNNNNNNIK